jgi:simple sugar transport system permease protein
MARMSGRADRAGPGDAAAAPESPDGRPVGGGEADLAPVPRDSLAMRFIRRPELSAFVALVLIYLVFSLLATHGFLTVQGTASWLASASELGVLALPVGLLMIAGEFDLSVGSMVGASSVVVSVGTGYYGLPIWASIALALALGALVGAGNGLLTVRTGLPSFIVTLAGLFIILGAGLGLSRAVIGTTAMTVYAHGSARVVFGGSWHGFIVSIAWWFAFAAIASWILHRARFGNWVFATGGNATAARAAGVPTARVKILLFVSTAVGAALVGVLETVQYNGGDVTYGTDLVFAAPVAAVVGGVLLGGGFGSAIGIVIGTAIYGILSVGISYTRVNSDWTDLFIGALLLLAVLGNNFFRRLAMRKP